MQLHSQLLSLPGTELSSPRTAENPVQLQTWQENQAATENCLSEDSKRIALLQCIKIIMIKTNAHQLNIDALTLHLPVDGI